jgi:peptidyl-prolyl cis-trans isomerase SurA
MKVRSRPVRFCGGVLCSTAMAWLVFVVPLLFVAGCKRGSAPSPELWAIVNGKEITRVEVEKYYRSRGLQQGGETLSHEEGLSLKLNILEELINQQILFARASRLGLIATDGEVEDKFTELKSPYTEEEFQRRLQEQGTTVEDLKQDLRRGLTTQKLINKEIIARVSISDAEIKSFYDSNRMLFNRPEAQYRVATILVTPHADPQIRNRKGDDARSEAAARQKLRMLEERLGNGEDFARLAEDYSEDAISATTGGDMGYIPASALDRAEPTLKQAILSLRVGETSRVISTRDGFRILKLLAREPAGQRDLADPNVQNSVRETLRNRKVQLLLDAYLKQLRSEAKITNYLAQQILESAGKLPAEPAASPTGQAEQKQ